MHAAEMKNSTFCHMPLDFISRIQDHKTRYYNLGWHPHADNQDTNLSFYVLISVFVGLCDHIPPMSQTDGQSDRHHKRDMLIWHVALKMQNACLLQISGYYDNLQLLLEIITHGLHVNMKTINTAGHYLTSLTNTHR